MAKSEEMIVSVRLPKSDLEKLRVLAQVYDKSVGELIRNATAKHVEELTSTDEFRTKAEEFQKTWDEVYSQLVRPRDTTTPKSTARKRRKRE
jgi:hypothetical protein